VSTTPTFELEFAEPHLEGPCPCCGGLTVRGTGFVTVDDGAYAIYYVRYANAHPDDELALIVSIGDFSEGSSESEREAFYCRLRPRDGSYALMLDDAGRSPWSEVALLGRKLTRDEAREHPLKETLFALTDAIGGSDPRVRGFFQRVACGDTATPLERTFDMPDEVWDIPIAEREKRAQIGKSFIQLDGDRCFVRALLGLPIEHYEEWSIGVWVEVEAATFQRARDAWHDPAQYLSLDFEGVLANDLGPLDLPAPRGIVVRVRARKADEALRIEDSAHAALRARCREPWDQREFERYAVGRGFL
jgi:hypothetical protein